MKKKKSERDINEGNIIMNEDDTEYNIMEDYNTDMNTNEFDDFPLNENDDNHL